MIDPNAEQGSPREDEDLEQFDSPIDELRGHLFDTIRGLKNKSMPVETARAIVQVATVLVDSAKVEVDMVRATKGRYVQGFIPYKGKPALAQPEAAPAMSLPSPAPAAPPQAEGTGGTVVFPSGYFKQGTDAE